MSYIVSYNQRGIVQCVYNNDTELKNIRSIWPNNHVVVHGILVNQGDYTKDNGISFKTPGDPPTPFSVFVYETETWQTDFTKAWESVRRQRDVLLNKSDWSEIPTAQNSLSEQEKQAYAQYRQALRDITDAPDPTNIVWPRVEDYLS